EEHGARRARRRRADHSDQSGRAVGGAVGGAFFAAAENTRSGKENRMVRESRHWIKPGIALLAISIGAALAQTERTLILNGKLASRDIRLIDGRPYVPIADVARALGQ